MLYRYIRSWEGYKLHIGSNLPPKDNLRKEDKSPAPKVSFIRRFHCTQLLPQPKVVLHKCTLGLHCSTVENREASARTRSTIPFNLNSCCFKRCSAVTNAWCLQGTHSCYCVYQDIHLTTSSFPSLYTLRFIPDCNTSMDSLPWFWSIEARIPASPSVLSCSHFICACKAAWIIEE